MVRGWDFRALRGCTCGVSWPLGVFLLLLLPLRRFLRHFNVIFSITSFYLGALSCRFVLRPFSTVLPFLLIFGHRLFIYGIIPPYICALNPEVLFFMSEAFCVRPELGRNIFFHVAVRNSALYVAVRNSSTPRPLVFVWKISPSAKSKSTMKRTCPFPGFVFISTTLNHWPFSSSWCSKQGSGAGNAAFFFT